MRRLLASCLLLSAAAVSAGEVEVRVADGRVDVRATAAAVSDILDRLSRQTGMKVVYDGPPPRPLVTVSLERVSPAAAVLGVLEGLGLNYALLLDPSATQVRTLMMVTATSASPGSSARPSAPTPPARREPPALEPEPEDEPEDEQPAGAARPGAEEGALPRPVPPGIVLPGQPSPFQPGQPYRPGNQPMPILPGMLIPTPSPSPSPSPGTDK